MQYVEFTLNCDEKGVSGFSLKGMGNTEAESFCLSFIKAQGLGKATVDIEGSKITFTHNGISEEEMDSRLWVWGTSPPGVHVANIPASDARQLEDLLGSKGRFAGTKVHVRQETAFGKGFTVYAK